MFKTGVVGDSTKPGCSEVNNAETSTEIDDTKTDTRKLDDNGSERVEGEIDITVLEKTNKISILVSC